MNQARFEQLFDRTIDEIRHLLVVKGGEYAGSEDRLANFKRGAALTGVTPMQCLLVYMSKHYDAVSTYIRDEAAGKSRPRSEPIEGRIDDLINYCILLKALVVEGKKEPEPATYDLGEFLPKKQRPNTSEKIVLQLWAQDHQPGDLHVEQILTLERDCIRFLDMIMSRQFPPGQGDRFMFDGQFVKAWKYISEKSWRPL